MKREVIRSSWTRRAILMVLLALGVTLWMSLAPGSALAQSYEAVVVGVDYPEGCLRIRSGPSTSAAIIGCASLGETLALTGLWSGVWAQIVGPIPGWVYGPQIDSGYEPPVTTSTVVVAPPIIPYAARRLFVKPYPRRNYWRHHAGPHRVYRGRSMRSAFVAPRARHGSRAFRAGATGRGWHRGGHRGRR